MFPVFGAVSARSSLYYVCMYVLLYVLILHDVVQFDLCLGSRDSSLVSCDLSLESCDLHVISLAGPYFKLLGGIVVCRRGRSWYKEVREGHMISHVIVT